MTTVHKRKPLKEMKSEGAYFEGIYFKEGENTRQGLNLFQTQHKSEKLKAEEQRKAVTNSNPDLYYLSELLTTASKNQLRQCLTEPDSCINRNSSKNLIYRLIT